MPTKKLILTYVDSLRTDMLLRAVAEGRAPTFGALIDRGVLVPDCVSSFPSVTPVACAEMVSGVGAERPLDQRHELVPPARAALRRVRLLDGGEPRLRRLPRPLRPRLQHEPRPSQPRGRDPLRAARRRRPAHGLHAVPDLPRSPPPPGLARRAAAPGGGRHPAQVPPPHLGPDRALLRRPLRQPRGALQIDLDPRQPRRLLGLLRRRACQGRRLRLPALLPPRQRQLLAPPRAGGERRVDRQGGPLLREAGRGRRGPRRLPRRVRADPDRRPRPDAGAPRPAARRAAGPRLVRAAALGGAAGARPARGQPDRPRGARLPAARGR